MEDKLLGHLRIRVTNGLSSSMHGKERLYSLKIQTAFVSTFALAPYEQGTKHLNDILERPEAMALRVNTVRDFIERRGEGIAEQQDAKAREVLEEHGFDQETLETKEGVVLPASITHPDVLTQMTPGRVVHNAVLKYNADEGNRYKIPGSHAGDLIEKKACSRPTVYIMVDGVFVKKQKEERGTREQQKARNTGEDRNKKRGPKGRKTVEVTDVVIECEGRKHYITMPDLTMALRATLAFLLENDLLSNRMLIFFTDGEKALKNRIDKVFSFRKTGMKYHLDYFHSSHKISEVGSMAFKMPKEEKNKIYAQLRGMLWVGDIDGIKKRVEGLDKSVIKNVKQQEYLIDYFNRKGDNMPCYALRDIFGLKNSSNAVEKANDILVSKRQKGLGMAFSKDGSISLASLAAAHYNGQLTTWLVESKVALEWAA